MKGKQSTRKPIGTTGDVGKLFATKDRDIHGNEADIPRKCQGHEGGVEKAWKGQDQDIMGNVKRT